MAATFYRTDYGGVARVIRDASSVHVDLFDVTARAWVPEPGIYGKVTGLGGDPPYDPISPAAAIELLGLEDRDELLERSDPA